MWGIIWGIYIYIHIYICKNYSNITWITNDFDGELKGESIHIPTEQEGIIVNSNYIYIHMWNFTILNPYIVVGELLYNLQKDYEKYEARMALRWWSNKGGSTEPKGLGFGDPITLSHGIWSAGFLGFLFEWKSQCCQGYWYFSMSTSTSAF